MNSGIEKRVAAVVVSYNRKQLLCECLDALLNQTYPVDAIYIIDNASTDGTLEFISEKGFIDKPLNLEKQPLEAEKRLSSHVFTDKIIEVYYVRMYENTGGAGGFHEGIKRGYDAGYEWLWLMDDDAEPMKDALEHLSRFFREDYVSGLANSVFSSEGKLEIISRAVYKAFPAFTRKPITEEKYNKKKIDIDFASFVGLAVNRFVIEKAGFPKKEFFLHTDDTEYCIRLRKYGKILLIPDSKVIHKRGRLEDNVMKIILGKKSFRDPFEKYWLRFYSIRNTVWLRKDQSHNKIIFYIVTLREILRLSLAIVLYDDNKIKRLKLLKNAFSDGVKGVFDNDKPKKILYG